MFTFMYTTIISVQITFNMTRFNIVLQVASVTPRSSGGYFWTCDVIVFIIFNMATVYYYNALE